MPNRRTRTAILGATAAALALATMGSAAPAQAWAPRSAPVRQVPATGAQEADGVQVFGSDSSNGQPSTAQETRAALPVKDTRPVQHCVQDLPTGKMTCYGTFRESIKAASGGAVTDAPLVGAPLSAAQEARLASAPADRKTGTGTSRLSATAAREIMEIVYSDRNFAGSTLAITGSGPCQDDGTYRTFELSGGEWDNRISSFKTYGHCQTDHFLDGGFQGKMHGTRANTERAYLPAAYDDSISSIKRYYGPTLQDLLDACGSRADSCDFETSGDTVEDYTDYHQVKKAYNCTNVEQRGNLAWADQTGGSYSIGTEKTGTIGGTVGPPFFLVKAEASFKETNDRGWTWSETFTQTDWFTAAPRQWVVLERATKLQSMEGTYRLHFSNGRGWGWADWLIQDFSGQGPVPQDAGVTRWRSGDVTSQECPSTVNKVLVRD